MLITGIQYDTKLYIDKIYRQPKGTLLPPVRGTTKHREGQTTNNYKSTMIATYNLWSNKLCHRW